MHLFKAICLSELALLSAVHIASNKCIFSVAARENISFESLNYYILLDTVFTQRSQSHLYVTVSSGGGCVRSDLLPKNQLTMTIYKKRNLAF